MNEWFDTNNIVPATNALVEVITEGYDVRQLRYHDHLWWLPDNSMYVYFTPVKWRYV